MALGVGDPPESNKRATAEQEYPQLSPFSKSMGLQERFLENHCSRDQNLTAKLLAKYQKEGEEQSLEEAKHPKTDINQNTNSGKTLLNQAGQQVQEAFPSQKALHEELISQPTCPMNQSTTDQRDANSNCQLSTQCCSHNMATSLPKALPLGLSGLYPSYPLYSPMPSLPQPYLYTYGSLPMNYPRFFQPPYLPVFKDLPLFNNFQDLMLQDISMHVAPAYLKTSCYGQSPNTAGAVSLSPINLEKQEECKVQITKEAQFSTAACTIFSSKPEPRQFLLNVPATFCSLPNASTPQPRVSPPPTVENKEIPLKMPVDKKTATSLGAKFSPSSLKKQNGKLKYECSICSKRFAQLSNLKVHFRVHSGEKPYQCQTCNKCFTQLAHLQKHHLVHTGEKPHQCLVCNKRFSSNSNLKTHLRLHSGERPYQCQLCHSRFAQYIHLKLHRRLHQHPRLHGYPSCHLDFSHSVSPEMHQHSSCPLFSCCGYPAAKVFRFNGAVDQCDLNPTTASLGMGMLNPYETTLLLETLLRREAEAVHSEDVAACFTGLPPSCFFLKQEEPARQMQLV